LPDFGPATPLSPTKIQDIQPAVLKFLIDPTSYHYFTSKSGDIAHRAKSSQAEYSLNKAILIDDGLHWRIKHLPE